MTESDDYADRVAREEIERRTRELLEGKVGFAKGTLVHARRGLQRVEDISPGDEVLTVNEPGQRPFYGRVLSSSSARAQLVRVIYHRETGGENRVQFVHTTLNHLFWVIGDGWNEARMLFSGFANQRRLLTCDGTDVVADQVKLVFATESESVGWLPGFANAVDEPGSEWDFTQAKPRSSGVFASDDVRDYETPFTYEVHELHVDGKGAFFVGDDGVLVCSHPGLESAPHAV